MKLFCERKRFWCDGEPTLNPRRDAGQKKITSDFCAPITD
jgi:hypothetical protein